MAGEKTVTYTAEQTAALVEQFTSGVTVEQLAETFGKSTRSVIAKLSREGVYKAKTVAKAARVTKADLVTKLAGHLGVERTTLESLEKASHEALEVLVRETKVLWADEEGEPRF
jgi:DNA-binding XRE family transcriptional regulator